MGSPAVHGGEDVTIAILVGLVVVLLWPILSGLAFLASAVLVLAVGGVLLWRLSSR